MNEDSLWPARNIAEYAYCPRLFYLMQVEGTFLPSTDTEKGNAVHRRVNQPSAQEDAAHEAHEAHSEVDPNRPKAVRSLALTSEKLELTATLDIAELTGTEAVPVEYRKGRPMRSVLAPPPDDPDEADNQPVSGPVPWPADRVQVALQALLLEDAGYTVNRAVLYYATEKLRLDVPMTDLLRTEARSVLEAAKLCAQGSRPPPLINDPKCPRCSLQPICLPDEVNLECDTGTGAPRCLWPPHEDGIQVVVQQKGTRVGVRGLCLRVVDNEGVAVSELPLAGVESLSVVGSVQISTQALQTLADRGIPVAWLSAAGRLVAMCDPLDSVSAVVRTAQVRTFDQEPKRLELARALIAAKITNQRTLLMRNHPNLAEGVPAELERLTDSAAQAESLASLRGFEGQAAAVYFKHFAGMFSGPEAAEFDENGRQRRPPPDPVNSCISMAYSMLTHECTAALRTARLEPAIGAFHSAKPGRPALSLDLMEPFRPLIADSIAVTAFNREELVLGHFARTASGCLFSDAGRKVFFSVWNRRLTTTVTHPEFGYKLSYRRMIILHARMIAAWVVGDIKTLSFLTTR
jgi:CRISPR-associated protein Cas1